MTQKVDNLKHGDLILVEYSGWNHLYGFAIYLGHKVDKDFTDVIISITFLRLEDIREEHIKTRNSTHQRVFKVTEDNLNEIELEHLQRVKKQLKL